MPRLWLWLQKQRDNRVVPNTSYLQAQNMVAQSFYVTPAFQKRITLFKNHAMAQLSVRWQDVDDLVHWFCEQPPQHRHHLDGLRAYEKKERNPFIVSTLKHDVSKARLARLFLVILYDRVPVQQDWFAVPVSGCFAVRLSSVAEPTGYACGPDVKIIWSNPKK